MACPKYDEIFRTIETNPPIQVQEINKKNAQLYAYLTEHTGQVIAGKQLTIFLFYEFFPFSV